jgi:hypothetical protein
MLARIDFVLGARPVRHATQGVFVTQWSSLEPDSELVFAAFAPPHALVRARL